MSGFEHFIADYERMTQAAASLFTSWTPAPLEPVTLDRQRHCLDAEALSEALNKREGAKGWCLFTDRLAVLTGEDRPALDGRVLSGELYVDGESIRIVQQQPGQWLWVSARAEAARPDGATHLASWLWQEGTARSPGRLGYRQLWAHDAHGRLRVTDALFQGFAGATQ